MLARSGNRQRTRLTAKQRVRCLLGQLEEEYALLVESGEGGGPMTAQRRLDFVREWAAVFDKDMGCED